MSADVSDDDALEREVTQLKEAIRSRTVIGQATGILMERYAIDADRAFALLVRISQEQNRKLRDIAADVTAAAGKPPT